MAYEDTLIIKNGDVVEVSRIKECLDVFQELTIEKIFILSERYKGSKSPYINQLEFDPNYGYISSLGLRYQEGEPFISLRLKNLIVLEQEK